MRINSFQFRQIQKAATRKRIQIQLNQTAIDLMKSEFKTIRTDNLLITSAHFIN